MRPPALEIRLILSAPGMGWEYVARKNGEAIAASDGEGFDQPGPALMACIKEVKAYAADQRAPILYDDERGEK